ncbi:FAD/NAD(P)-binding domain-containing protein [Lentinula lateritia]|uniref:FAD/NAD(P)-binding domain-containing protein n=1 Tax=Lentinula lateritia TaxID=40482 RepID=A0ABQ8V903_9AGAR|nr:FAD/NAD(P)-binding domain-containing protein [Lentinula lateritia]
MSLHNQSSNKKSTIVIVGGGAGGLSLLNNLSTTIDPDEQRVILIDARPTMIHLASTLRLVVSDADNLLKRSIHPYGDHTFRNKLTGTGIFIHASVKEIDFGKPGDGGILTLDNGGTVAYDVLVLATGSTWPRPIAFPTENMNKITEHVQKIRAEFAAAQDILLVGGGSVGIELSGELRDVFPSKPITIIHREKYLLNATYPDKYRIAVQKQLEGRGITILTGDAISALDASNVAGSQISRDGFITEQGKTLKADLVIPTWGTRPNTTYLPSDLLSSTGHVKILPTFQLPAHPNVFAFGDIMDWNEQKTAANASFFQAPKVAKNIILYLRESEGIAKYNGSFVMIMVTNGKTSGMSYFNILWGIIVGGWISSLMKSKDLMVSRISGMTGYTPV